MILGMPNENHGSRARILGWRSLTSLQWMLLPLRPERMLARKLRVPWLGRHLWFVGDAWRSLMVHARQRTAEIDVREVTTISDPSAARTPESTTAWATRSMSWYMSTNVVVPERTISAIANRLDQ